jgi:hypothetical protein
MLIMTEEAHRHEVEDTQRQIAMLLAALEAKTGCYVEGIAIRNIEVTTVSSTAPEYLRRVDVDLRRQPGSRWQT